MKIVLRSIALVLVSCAMVFLGMTSFAYVPTTDDGVNEDGVIDPFSFNTEFYPNSKPIAATSAEVPIYRKGKKVTLKWNGIERAAKYKFIVKNLKTDKTVYSATTKGTTASFPATKNKSEGSFRVYISALDSKGKTLKTYRTVFHTGKIVVNTSLNVDYGNVLWVVSDLKSDISGVAWQGMYGEIQDDGTLRITGEKAE